MNCAHDWEIRDSGYTEETRIPWVHYQCRDCSARRLVCDERDYLITDDAIESYAEAS